MKEYRVPLRVALGGMGLDIPSRIRYNTGMSISCAIEKYVHVRITTTNHEPSFIEPECDLIDRLLQKLPFAADIPRMQIRWHTDIPLGMGLGGSSALLVALSKHFFEDPFYQAHFASTVELERGGGWQDPAICAYGGCRAIKYRHDTFTLSESFRPPDSNNFMLVSTKQRHDTKKQYKKNILSSTETIKQNSERVSKIAAALRRDDYTMIGELLDETYQIRNRLSDNYTTAPMHDFYLDALSEGAYGGMLMGSGGGGHFILVIDPSRRGDLLAVAEKYRYACVSFTFHNEVRKEKSEHFMSEDYL